MKPFPKLFFCLLAVVGLIAARSQPVHYTTANLHAHNDYEKSFPFFESFLQRVGSMEVDIFLENGMLLVGHDKSQLTDERSLARLYLEPLESLLAQNNGYIEADTGRRLQLMVDLKTPANPTLDSLISLLRNYPSITRSRSVSLVITGNQPPVTAFPGYPPYILFDGNLETGYPAAALARVPLFSEDLRRYTNWNGKNLIPAAERERIQSAIGKAHAQGKKIRFWNTPDTLRAWYQFMQLGVDWINTDHVIASARFMNTLPHRVYRATAPYTLYEPDYRADGSKKRPKNIILLIGDGMGLPQIYAGYTANHGALNLFSFRHTGISKTSSYDSYITDSAPGSTAFSSGTKTNNRAVGVDHTGKALPLLPAILRQKGKKTGVITSGDFTDATPADFYAHQSERSESEAIIRDLENSAVDILMGAAGNAWKTKLPHLIPSYHIVSTPDSIGSLDGQKWVVADPRAGHSILEGRGNWLSAAFDKTVETLSNNKQGFLMVVEGAQIDHGAHANNLPFLVTEMLDFDKVIARALDFADRDGETLVIVTADHETGGLTLQDGDYATGYVSGQFATNDHTAVPVPVFAYGPQSQLFDGVYENTAVFHKILEALGMNKK